MNGTNKTVLNKTNVILFVSLLSLAVILVSQYGGSVNKENYDKIQNGMTRSEVEAILGPDGVELPVTGETGPDLNISAVQWKKGIKHIEVVFLNDTVFKKSSKHLW